MSPKSIAGASIAFGLMFAATAALAHARLDRAEPGVGAEVTSPKRLTLTFTEGVEPKFSSVTLASASGEAEPLGPLGVDPANSALMVVTIDKALPPGVYTVKWKATSIDTHKTQGSFTFTVKP